MVYSQLFGVTDEDQQNALRRAQNELGLQAQNLQGLAGLGGLNTGALMGLSNLGLAAGANGAAAFAGLGTASNASGSAQAASNQLMQLQQAQASLQQQLNQQLSQQFNQQLNQQLGQQLNVPSVPNSMLDIQRAENILAAMAQQNQNQHQQLMGMANNQFNTMNVNNAIGAQNLRLNGLLPGANADILQVKNHAFPSLATTHAASTGMQDSSLDGRLSNKRRRSSGTCGSISPLRKRLSGTAGMGRLSGSSEMKLAAELVALEEASRGKDPPSTSKSRKKAKTFPVKLMQALIENPNEDAVAWLPDGKSFVIVQPDLFCNYVLKKVFKECKYASFVRKLHRWGFVRLTSGTGTDCFHHPMFQRNRVDWAARIVCTPREANSKAPEESGGKKQKNSPVVVVDNKPPSLAGVEKFFRSSAGAKVTVAAGGNANSDKTTAAPTAPPEDGKQDGGSEGTI